MSVFLSLGGQLKWPTGRALRSESPHEMCDVWRAPRGGTARLAYGRGSTTWGARKGDEDLIDVMCWLVCPCSSVRVMSPFQKCAAFQQHKPVES